MTFDDNATILEGTWEEIAAHAPEWNGKRLRVSVEVLETREGVETNGKARDEKPISLAEDLAGYIGVIDGPETDISSRAKELWGEYVEEKHRRIQEQRRES